MLKFLNGWKSPFSSQSATPCKRTHKKRHSRALRMEHLEDRRVLAIIQVDTPFDERDFTITGGDDISLRDAILEAQDGDTVVFASSLNGATINLLSNLGEIAFDKNLIIDASNLSRGITIDASSADPTPTQNNGDGIRIFNITNPSGSTSVTLKGLTLTGGDVAGAGGAIQSVASLTLQECVITGNASQSTGGGVHFNGNGNAALQVIASTISGNSALGNGGGIRAYLTGTSTFSLTDATVSDNTADVHGGGVFAVANATDQNSTQQMITVERSVVSGNAAGFTGGGMYLKAIGASRIHVEDTRVTDNEASLKGGGLYAYVTRNGDPEWSNGRFTLTRSTVDNNRAGMEGGGVFLCGKHGSNFVVTNSTISGNQTLDSTSGQGGGIQIARESYYNTVEADLRNVTITKNKSATGGGLRVIDVDKLDVQIGNSIISENFNHAGTSPNNLVGRVVDEVFKHNLVGTGSSFLNEDGVGFTPDATNITSDNPLLSELGLFGGPTPTHRLMPGSPAIDKGSATIAAALSTDQRGTGFSRAIDITGVANGADGYVDIGAFETGDAPLYITEVTVLSSTANQTHHPPYNFSTVAGSGQQLRTVPVAAADTVEVKFSTAVANEGTAGQTAITMHGLTTGTTLVVAQYTSRPGPTRPPGGSPSRGEGFRRPISTSSPSATCSTPASGTTWTASGRIPSAWRPPTCS